VLQMIVLFFETIVFFLRPILVLDDYFFEKLGSVTLNLLRSGKILGLNLHNIGDMALFHKNNTTKGFILAMFLLFFGVIKT